jgi:hypothetical protein
MIAMDWGICCGDRNVLDALCDSRRADDVSKRSPRVTLHDGCWGEPALPEPVMDVKPHVLVE